MNLLKKIKLFIKKILSPPFCFYCRNFLNDYLVLCESCNILIKSIPSYSMKITQNINMNVYSICEYKDPVKTLILAKKWSDYAASVQLAHLIWQNSNLKNLEFDYLVPIPLHWTRYAKRGYNQAEIIAKELAILSKKPMVLCIKRCKKTLHQFLLSSAGRNLNVANVFELNSGFEYLENKKIVLVDDLMTTGSTLKSAAKTLIKTNPKSISAIVASRVL